MEVYKSSNIRNVVLLGHGGSGKTSLINLIPGFYKASEGAVLINGEDVRDIDERALRDRTGMVFQKEDEKENSYSSFNDCDTDSLCLRKR